MPCFQGRGVLVVLLCMYLVSPFSSRALSENCHIAGSPIVRYTSIATKYYVLP